MAWKAICFLSVLTLNCQDIADAPSQKPQTGSEGSQVPSIDQEPPPSKEPPSRGMPKTHPEEPPQKPTSPPSN
jgi:hypothetical protein